MKPLGHTLIRLEEVASTNTLVLERPDWLADHGLVVLARHQTAGRGRLGRTFASLPGRQLLFSVVVHPRLRTEEVPVCSLVAGLAVAEALEVRLGLRPRLKWPNDVLLGGRKVCGILVEMRADEAGRPRLVIGIGINCQGDPADFPSDLAGVVTTLERETGAPVDSEGLLAEVLAALGRHLLRLEGGHKAAVLADWERRARLAGRRVRFATNQRTLEGVALGLTPEGFLRIATADGARHTHVSGDLEWL